MEHGYSIRTVTARKLKLYEIHQRDTRQLLATISADGPRRALQRYYLDLGMPRFCVDPDTDARCYVVALTNNN